MNKRFDTSQLGSGRETSAPAPAGGKRYTSNDLAILAGDDRNHHKLSVLLQGGAHPDQTMSTYPPLHAAIRENALLNAQLLLEQGADPNYVNAMTEPPLYVAAASGNLKAVKLLLDHTDIEMDKRVTGSGYTAMHAAAQKGNMEIVQALLDAGAKRDVRDFYDAATPLDLVKRRMEGEKDTVAKRRMEAVVELLEHGKGPKSRQAIMDKANADLCKGRPHD